MKFIRQGIGRQTYLDGSVFNGAWRKNIPCDIGLLDLNGTSYKTSEINFKVSSSDTKIKDNKSVFIQKIHGSYDIVEKDYKTNQFYIINRYNLYRGNAALLGGRYLANGKGTIRDLTNDDSFTGDFIEGDVSGNGIWKLYNERRSKIETITIEGHFGSPDTVGNFACTIKSLKYEFSGRLIRPLFIAGSGIHYRGKQSISGFGRMNFNCGCYNDGTFERGRLVKGTMFNIHSQITSDVNLESINDNEYRNGTISAYDKNKLLLHTEKGEFIPNENHWKLAEGKKITAIDSVGRLSNILLFKDAKLSSSYRGEASDELPNGFGKCKWYKDDTRDCEITYIGQCKDGSMHGKGKIMYNNIKYKGSWDDDVKVGDFFITLPDKRKIFVNLGTDKSSDCDTEPVLYHIVGNFVDLDTGLLGDEVYLSGEDKIMRFYTMDEKTGYRDKLLYIDKMYSF
jgi:hypothetical protein